MSFTLFMMLRRLLFSKHLNVGLDARCSCKNIPFRWFELHARTYSKSFRNHGCPRAMKKLRNKYRCSMLDMVYSYCLAFARFFIGFPKLCKCAYVCARVRVCVLCEARVILLWSLIHLRPVCRLRSPAYNHFSTHEQSATITSLQ